MIRGYDTGSSLYQMLILQPFQTPRQKKKREKNKKIEVNLMFCSVGGTDYGSVRVGAFMGRKIIRSTASTLLSRSLSPNGIIPDDAEEDGTELLEEEASLDYLCNLSPHR